MVIVIDLIFRCDNGFVFATVDSEVFIAVNDPKLIDRADNARNQIHRY